MDPNATLARIRSIVEEVNAWRDGKGKLSHGDKCDLLGELADLNSGLDDWIKRGGFLPHNWDVNRSLSGR